MILPNQSRQLDYLMSQDPDVLVDILMISSEELIEAFEDKVMDYLEDNIHVEDEEADYD